MSTASDLIALVALLTLSILTGLGNWWYTFGIWPRSWTAFIVCALVQTVLSGLMSFVMKNGGRK